MSPLSGASATRASDRRTISPVATATSAPMPEPLDTDRPSGVPSSNMDRCALALRPVPQRFYDGARENVATDLVRAQYFGSLIVEDRDQDGQNREGEEDGE